MSQRSLILLSQNSFSFISFKLDKNFKVFSSLLFCVLINLGSVLFFFLKTLVNYKHWKSLGCSLSKKEIL